jgi:hypothetical protein
MFVIKIIYNQNGNLRVVGSNNSTVDLIDLYFYIPKELRNNFYCRLTDVNKTEDIVRLTPSDTSDKVYNVYQISLDNYITCENGQTTLSIISISDDLIKKSDNLDIDINYDAFKTGSNISLIAKMDSDIARKYEQIRQLTELNIEIHKDIEEALLND